MERERESQGGMEGWMEDVKGGREVEAELEPGGGAGCHGAASGPDLRSG